MMNNIPQIPETQIRETSLKKMREISLMFDSQIMLLDELIARVEAQNRQSVAHIYCQKKEEKSLSFLEEQ